MYYAIVFLPLLGAVIAALIALAGARARHPGGPPAAAHGPADADHSVGHGEHEQAPPPAAGSRAAELVTTVFLFAAMLLSWVAFVDVGFGHHDGRAAIFPWMISGDLK